MPNVTPWPSTEEYSLAHRCPRCRAEPGEPCDAPNKPAYPWHVARVDAGIRHYYRDVARAPWSEDRIPGVRYDSLGSTPTHQ